MQSLRISGKCWRGRGVGQLKVKPESGSLSPNALASSRPINSVPLQCVVVVRQPCTLVVALNLEKHCRLGCLSEVISRCSLSHLVSGVLVSVSRGSKGGRIIEDRAPTFILGTSRRRSGPGRLCVLHGAVVEGRAATTRCRKVALEHRAVREAHTVHAALEFAARLEDAIRVIFAVVESLHSRVGFIGRHDGGRPSSYRCCCCCDCCAIVHVQNYPRYTDIDIVPANTECAARSGTWGGQ